MKKIKLYNGVEIPQIGYGTWMVEDSQVGADAVKLALQNGYSHIDGAAAYKNEVNVGKGIKESGRNREDIFITSKVPNSHHGYDSTIKIFNKSLKDLDLEYLDLYLIHWPRPQKFHDNYIVTLRETWRALEDLYYEGKVKAIGVSNCKIHHLEEIMETCRIKPMINQIEFHPSCTSDELRKFCQEHDIIIEGYSIYAHGEAFKCDELKLMAEKYNTNIGKICLQYALQKDVVALIKSMKPERIIDNIKIDFTISDEDMKIIDEIKTCGGIYTDPDNCGF